MIVRIGLDSDEVPLTISFGVIDPRSMVGEPSITFQYDGAVYGLDEMREHLSGLEDTRRKYQEIMRALGK
jgi:hypothetical protein